MLTKNTDALPKLKEARRVCISIVQETVLGSVCGGFFFPRKSATHVWNTVRYSFEPTCARTGSHSSSSDSMARVRALFPCNDVVIFPSSPYKT